MKIMKFEVTVAVPDFLEDISGKDLYDLLYQTGEVRKDLHECAWEIYRLRSVTVDADN